jgi:hypothetical protein
MIVHRDEPAHRGGVGHQFSRGSVAVEDQHTVVGRDEIVFADWRPVDTVPLDRSCRSKCVAGGLDSAAPERDGNRPGAAEVPESGAGAGTRDNCNWLGHDWIVL